MVVIRTSDPRNPIHLAKTKAEAYQITERMKSMGFKPRVVKLKSRIDGYEEYPYQIIKVAHYFPLGRMTRKFGDKTFTFYGQTGYARKSEAEAIASNLRANKPRRDAQVKVAPVSDREFRLPGEKPGKIWCIYTWGF